ncbi:subtilisin family serine protease [Actinoplanes tereljensis]|uniref:Uncharacterized protein n=1 Tax=Paractinoplanes tereljensis TaxID=571912 RepID=A0A919NN59_9ACTN|nr:S8 family serine peptidase [Actinoplanes tereljensis]GIF20637.1 hypothetical protein Ate02nite_33670 [Actinoplanes tereljensis]
MRYRLPAATAAVIAAATLGVSVTATPVFAAATSTTPSQLIVGLRSASTAAATVRKLDADPDVKVLSSDASAELSAVTVAVPAADRADAVATLKADPNVAYVETNAVASADDVTPDDAFYARQWGLATSKTPAAWDVTTGDAVVVAVVDTGVNEVSEIAGRVLPGYDFVNDDSDPSDDAGHGTAVATVAAAAGNNGAAMVGVCWQCRILPVKVLGADGTGTYDNIAKGITYAVDNGADVINLSLGGAESSQLLDSAVQYAYAHNVVVVASAGNDSKTTRTYPAASIPAIAVAGSTQGDGRYSWSNYNATADQWVDLAAPGSNIAQSASGGNFTMFEGTSSAAPLVAGAAGLVLSAKPDATADQVRDALENSGDSIGTWVAKGRLNVGRAVQQITASPALSISEIATSPVSPARGKVTVTPTVASTAGGIKTVKMTVTQPNGKTIATTATKAPFSMVYNSTGITGAVAISITATDTAGNSTTAGTVLNVDNTAPSAALTLSSFVTGPTAVTLANPSDDIAEMDVYVKNVLVGTVTSAPWTYDWDTSGLAGTIPVKVSVTDLAGNSSTTTKNVGVDNAGPKLAWGGPTVATKSALRGTVEVKATATDTAGVASVEVLDAAGNVLGADTTTPYVIPVDGSSFSGDTTLTLRATDKLGQITTVDKTVLFDNTAPVVGDIAASAARGNLVLTPDVTDDTGLRSVKMALTLPSGKTVTISSPTTAPYAAKWGSAGITGTVSAAITATDWAGNVTTATSTFVVDNTAPSAAWTLPSAYANGIVPIALTTASDDTATMDVLVKGKSIAQLTSAPWSIDWDTTGLSGAFAVAVKTTDAAGNTTTVNKTINVDYAGPKVTVFTVKFPAAAATQIRTSVTDPAGVESLELLDAAGQSLATSTTSPYTLTVDTSAMSKGAATWTLKATDKLGNVSTTTKVVTVS